MTERKAFIDAHPHLDLTEIEDAWGRPMFAHSHVEAMWSGWRDRAMATVRLSNGRADCRQWPGNDWCVSPRCDCAVKAGHSNG